MVTFGLNALYGKTVKQSGMVVGDWNSSNAESLLRYTVDKGYPIVGWELGKFFNSLMASARPVVYYSYCYISTDSNVG